MSQNQNGISSRFSSRNSSRKISIELGPSNNNLGTATLNVVPSTATSSSQSAQFGVDSGLTTANTNAALSLNPFLNQQSQASRLTVRRVIIAH